MFMVLIVHADFKTLGSPSVFECQNAPLSSITRIFFQSLSIGCVDIFILISGWFGIRPRKSSAINFIFQCLFFTIGIYVICVCLGLSQLSLNGIAGCFMLLKDYWFIKAYFLLYLLSPILNVYIENAKEKQIRLLLISFFTFQTIFSWISGASIFFVNGNSTISFIGLYLLARYVAKYQQQWVYNYNKSLYLVIFLISVLFMMLVFYEMKVRQLDSLSKMVFRYDQPIVIAASLSILLFFNKMNFKNKIINYVASSSFAVYIIHVNPNIFESYFVNQIKKLFETYNDVYCLITIFSFLVAIFFISVLLDQIRKIVWIYLERKQTLCLNI